MGGVVLPKGTKCQGSDWQLGKLRGFLALLCLVVNLGCGELSLASRTLQQDNLIRDSTVYCPTDPAFGQLAFKSVDSRNSFCAPSAGDGLGSAVYACWQSLTIEVNGCKVTMRPDDSQLVGPGRLPCRFFHLAGNLTNMGVEAVMWADVDGPGLLSYYDGDPKAVEALKYGSSRQLVRDLWAFLRNFTTDPRFDDDSWIDGHHHSHAGNTQEPQEPQELRHRHLRVAGSAAAGGDAGAPGASEGLMGAGMWQGRRGPMRVYRPSQTRVVLKVPTGCKYRYSLNPGSHVFESPAQHRAHVQWRTIGLTVAALSVLLAVVGLGACTYFSHKHAQYVASYWEYEAVKDQLGAQLPPSTYQRLFGAPPKGVVPVAPHSNRPAAVPPTAAAPPAAAAAATAEAAVPLLGEQQVGIIGGAESSGAAISQIVAVAGAEAAGGVTGQGEAVPVLLPLRTVVTN